MEGHLTRRGTERASCVQVRRRGLRFHVNFPLPTFIYPGCTSLPVGLPEQLLELNQSQPEAPPSFPLCLEVPSNDGRVPAVTVLQLQQPRLAAGGDGELVPGRLTPSPRLGSVREEREPASTAGFSQKQFRGGVRCHNCGSLGAILTQQARPRMETMPPTLRVMGTGRVGAHPAVEEELGSQTLRESIPEDGRARHGSAHLRSVAHAS